jgi:hypothetical protein
VVASGAATTSEILANVLKPKEPLKLSGSFGFKTLAKFSGGYF